jgi:hypothetical protein
MVGLLQLSPFYKGEKQGTQKLFSFIYLPKIIQGLIQAGTKVFFFRKEPYPIGKELDSAILR